MEWGLSTSKIVLSSGEGIAPSANPTILKKHNISFNNQNVFYQIRIVPSEEAEISRFEEEW